LGEAKRTGEEKGSGSDARLFLRAIPGCKKKKGVVVARRPWGKVGKSGGRDCSFVKRESFTASQRNVRTDPAFMKKKTERKRRDATGTIQF